MSTDNSRRTTGKPLGSYLLFLILFILFPFASYAAEYVWNCGCSGENADKWSCQDNWSPKGTPGTADTVRFQSAKNCDVLIQAPVEVSSFLVDSGYSGTTTQNGRLKVTNTFRQQSGTFISNDDIYVGGFWVHSGGTFTQNSGTVTFEGNQTNYVTLSTSATFNNLAVSKTGAGTVSVNLSGDVTVKGVLSLFSGSLNRAAGTANLKVEDQMTNSDGFGGGSLTVELMSDKTRTVTLNSNGKLPGLVLKAANATYEIANDNQLEVMGGLTLTAGIFNGNSGRVKVTDNNFQLNGGEFNVGTGGLRLDRQLVLNGGTVNAGDGDIIINSHLTLNGGTLNAGAGNIEVKSNFYIYNGAAFNGGAGNLSVGPSDGHFYCVGGNFRAPSGIFSLSGGWAQTGCDFEHNNGTVSHIGSSRNGLNVPVSETFYHLTFNRGHRVDTVLGESDTLIVLGTLSLLDGGVSERSATIDARGDVIHSPNFDASNAAVKISGPTERTVTIDSAGHFPGLYLASPNVTVNVTGNGTPSFGGGSNSGYNTIEAGVLNLGAANVAFGYLTISGGKINDQSGSGTITVNANFNQTSGVFNSGTGEKNFRGLVTHTGGTFNQDSGNINATANWTINGSADFNGGAANIAVGPSDGHFFCSGGNFQAPSGTFSITGGWAQTGCDFDHNGGTVRFSGSSSGGINLPGSETFYHFVVDKTNGVYKSVMEDDRIIVEGTFSMLEGMLINQSGAQPGRVEARGNIYQASTYDGGTTPLLINGSGDQTFSGNATSSSGDLQPVRIEKTGGTLTLGEGTNNSLRTEGADWTYTAGNVNATANNSTVYFAGPVKLDGEGAGGAMAFDNLSFTSGETTLQGKLDLNGNLTLAGGTLTAGSQNIEVAGEWAFASGGFNAGSGTVTLDGTSQTISGSTTFNNLTKVTNLADMLTFGAGSTQTISGTLRLEGAAGQPLSLRSTSTGTQWRINPAGRSVTNVDVRDSNNIHATAISGLNLVDSGNNTNWNFPLPTVSFTTASQTQDEAVGSMTVTASLSAASGQDVTVPFSVGGTATGGTDFSITTSPVTILAGNTSATITITVTDDTRDESDETVIVTMGTPTNATRAAVTTHTATITDNDGAPTVSLSAEGSPVAENGGTGTVKATLSEASAFNVNLDLAISGTAMKIEDYNFSADTLFIPAGNTSASVTVTAVSDSLDEAEETIVVGIGNVTNASATGNPVELTIADDDPPQPVSLTLSGSPFGENGGTATVTASIPGISGQDIAVKLGLGGSATPNTDYSITTDTITILAGNLTAAATITGIDDAVDEADEEPTIDIVSVTNGIENGNQQVTATITDNDAPPTVSLSSAGSPLAEDGGTGTITATLSAVSSLNVSINLAVSGTAVKVEDYNLSANTLFIPAGNTSASVTVTAVSDSLDEADETVAVAIGSATNATAAGDPVSVVIQDDNESGILISHTGGSTSVTEGSVESDTYTIALSSQPAEDVTVTLSTDDNQVTFGPSELTFTSDNWGTAQTVTVSAVDDNDIEGNHAETIRHESASDDGNYDGIGLPSLSAQITDNDSAGIGVVQSSGETSVTEGGAGDTYTIVLTTSPSRIVRINLSSSDESLGVLLSEDSLTFTRGNWNVPQTVTVTAADDRRAEGNHSARISHEVVSLDDDYDQFDIADIVARISDNDTAGVSVSQTEGSTAAAEIGGDDSYEVVLLSQPTAAVSIHLSHDAQVAPSADDLLFSPLTWDTPQTVTVRAVDDFVAEGNHASTLTHSVTSTDNNYSAILVSNVVVSLTDNDSAGVRITPRIGATVGLEEGAETDTYTVVLTSRPSSPVDVTLEADSQVETDLELLQFTPANWNLAQTITVSAVDDNRAEGSHSGVLSHSVQSADLQYNGIAVANMVASIIDNDVAAIVVSSTEATNDVAEGGQTDSFSVVLSSQPSDDVRIQFQTGGEISVTPSSLLFTAGDWNNAQWVTITAIDDERVEGEHSDFVLFTVTSNDGDYSGYFLENLGVSVVTDNDTAAEGDPDPGDEAGGDGDVGDDAGNDSDNVGGDGNQGGNDDGGEGEIGDPGNQGEGQEENQEDQEEGESSQQAATSGCDDGIVTATNIMTDEICGQALLSADCRFEIDLDLEKARDPDDPSQLRVVFRAAIGSSLIVEKYWESEVAEGSTAPSSIGTVDTTSTFSVAFLREKIKNLERDKLQHQSQCLDTFMSGLFIDSSESEEGVGGTIGAVREVIECLMAQRIPCSELGCQNYSQLIGDLMNGRLDPYLLKTIILVSGVRCGLEAGALDDRTSNIHEVLPALGKFAVEWIASDEATCEMVQKDDQEREIWLDVTQAMDADLFVSDMREEDSPIMETIASLIEKARSEDNLDSFIGQERAKRIVATVSDHHAHGDEKRLEMEDVEFVLDLLDEMEDSADRSDSRTISSAYYYGRLMDLADETRRAIVEQYRDRLIRYLHERLETGEEIRPRWVLDHLEEILGTRREEESEPEDDPIGPPVDEPPGGSGPPRGGDDDEWEGPPVDEPPGGSGPPRGGDDDDWEGPPVNEPPGRSGPPYGGDDEEERGRHEPPELGDL